MMIRKTVAALALFTASATSVAVMEPAVAQTTRPADDPVTLQNGLRNGSTGRCLDDSLQYGLRPLACNYLNYQSWAAPTVTDNGFTLVNSATGRCLDDSSQYGLRTLPCNGLDYQTWYGRSQFDSNGAVYANRNTGRCIDDSLQYGLRSYTCNGSYYQDYVAPLTFSPAVVNTAGNIAYQQIGKPYVYGGDGPNGFDCSGLVQWSYMQAGIPRWMIDRIQTSQYPQTRPIDYSQITRGDLIFYDNVGHVAIYYGGNEMVEAANPGTGIVLTPVRPGGEVRTYRA